MQTSHDQRSLIQQSCSISKTTRFIGANWKTRRNIDESRTKKNGSDTIEAWTDAFLHYSDTVTRQTRKRKRKNGKEICQLPVLAGLKPVFQNTRGLLTVANRIALSHPACLVEVIEFDLFSRAHVYTRSLTRTCIHK